MDTRKYIAFLRGINISWRHRLPMADLKKEVLPKLSGQFRAGVVGEGADSRLDAQFFLDNLGVAVAEISAFVNLVAGKGFSERLLRKDKEIDLIQFLVGQR